MDTDRFDLAFQGPRVYYDASISSVTHSYAISGGQMYSLARVNVLCGFVVLVYGFEYTVVALGVVRHPLLVDWCSHEPSLDTRPTRCCIPVHIDEAISSTAATCWPVTLPWRCADCAMAQLFGAGHIEPSAANAHHGHGHVLLPAVRHLGSRIRNWISAHRCQHPDRGAALPN